MDGFQYCPYIKCFNQSVFIPRVYDKERDLLEKIEYVEFECELCQNRFVSRDLFVQKNRHKIYCQNCRLCNDTFKIRNCLNYLKEKVIYQSQLELKFIRYCNDNQVIILNGPTLGYSWNGTLRRYRIAFYLPDLRWLIALEDDHVWHKQQVANGIWAAKSAIANSILDGDRYKRFLLALPKNYVQLTQEIKLALALELVASISSKH